MEVASLPAPRQHTRMHRRLAILALMTAAATAAGQTVAATPRAFTHADTLRGSNGPGRSWWDAEFYDLHVAVNPADSTISGWNRITYRVLEAHRDHSTSKVVGAN